ncbi:unnamed protein product, partial [Brassica oleracea]
VLPIAIDISAKTPDESRVALKGISTDIILGVRKLLAVHVQTCHFTNFSPSHQERGQLIYEDIEDYLNQRKQHLNKLQRMLNIGICVNVAVTPVTSNPENSGPPIISRIIKAHIPNYTHPKPK